jgi:putative ribosome biogenesis GTPase RsgA
VGNKIDESAELREVTHAEGQAQAAEWGVQFMETSAKTNHNVTELFQVCSREKLLKSFLGSFWKSS